ncbi:MAG: hypothetical protein ACREPR_22455 [Brasilonema sp.]
MNHAESIGREGHRRDCNGWSSTRDRQRHLPRYRKPDLVLTGCAR